jgi:hypothetical protein
MPRRRRGGDEERQKSFAWFDREHILEAAPVGEVLFEAPELRPRARRAAAAPKTPPPPPTTMGLPFGVREVDGSATCWSCGKAIDEATVIHVGPGDTRCPGCGAKLPFVP